MNKRTVFIILGAVAGAYIGRQCFKCCEEVGLPIFQHGRLSLHEFMKMAFTSSGAIKIWLGAVVGGVVGGLISEKLH